MQGWAWQKGRSLSSPFCSLCKDTLHLYYNTLVGIGICIMMLVLCLSITLHNHGNSFLFILAQRSVQSSICPQISGDTFEYKVTSYQFKQLNHETLHYILFMFEQSNNANCIFISSLN